MNSRAKIKQIPAGQIDQIRERLAAFNAAIDEVHADEAAALQSIAHPAITELTAHAADDLQYLLEEVEIWKSRWLDAQSALD